MTSKDLLDPWQNPFKYERPGKNNPRSFDLYTFGADGQAGGDGENSEIGNWEADAPR